MRPAFLRLCALLLMPVAVVNGGQSAAPGDLAALLAQVGAAVERYYARAQSIICIETVRMQSLGTDMVADHSPMRQLTYELRVAWEDAADGQTPEAIVQ